MRDFELDFSKYIGVKYAIATSFARTAIYPGLKAIDARGKQLMVPCFTCNVVRDAICLAGATPVFIESNPQTLDMDLEDVKRKVTIRTKAIIVVHYYGGVCGNCLDIGKISLLEARDV
ncbi:MAG: DegT/DnrJ/EryC1/StrS family aminotransferase [Desulfobacteraceae bacterium]|nr:DegT/DnrJ/EryC1/StrS family aminotransferase [Desulfobacteraceae bacterium]